MNSTAVSIPEIHYTRGEFIELPQKARKILVITEKKVFEKHREYLNTAEKANSGKTFHFFFLFDSEHLKSLSSAEEIYQFMAKIQFTRSDCVLAFGGGKVTDLAGFVAATYFRGVSFVSVPTTLLAMVDASVGGKTGVNLSGVGKNLVGAIYHPSECIIK